MGKTIRSISIMRGALSPFVALLMLTALTGRCCAANEPARPSLPPGWEGVYTILHGLIPESGGRRILADDGDDLVPLHPDHGAEASSHMLPWGLEEAKLNANYSAVDDLSAICGPAGIFRHPTTVVGWMVLGTADEVLLVSEDLNQVGVRRIFLTDHHPVNLPLTWNGHSIGHWEGDTLVVDTIGFNDKSWLGSELQPHSEELHVIERIRSLKNGRFLEIYTTVDDHKALTGPYSYSRYYRRTDKPFEQVASTCNAEIGEQATWNYQRQQAIQQFERNRQGSK